MRSTPILTTLLSFISCFGFDAVACAQSPGYFDYLADDRITLLYNPSDGSMGVEANGEQISTLELTSESGIFTGTPVPDLVLPPFDVLTPVKFFLLKTDGMGDTHFGPIAEPGLAFHALNADLTINGSILPSGGLGSPNLAFVPEPASAGLALGGLVGLAFCRRRRV